MCCYSQSNKSVQILCLRVQRIVLGVRTEGRLAFSRTVVQVRINHAGKHVTVSLCAAWTWTRCSCLQPSAGKPWAPALLAKEQHRPTRGLVWHSSGFRQLLRDPIKSPTFHILQDYNLENRKHLSNSILYYIFITCQSRSRSVTVTTFVCYTSIIVLCCTKSALPAAIVPNATVAVGGFVLAPKVKEDLTVKHKWMALLHSLSSHGIALQDIVLPGRVATKVMFFQEVEGS